VVQGPAEHGIPGLVNLYGIESPGLTASLPLADEVVKKLAAVAGHLDDDFAKAATEEPKRQDRPALDELFR